MNPIRYELFSVRSVVGDTNHGVAVAQAAIAAANQAKGAKSGDHKSSHTLSAVAQIATEQAQWSQQQNIDYQATGQYREFSETEMYMSYFPNVHTVVKRRRKRFNTVVLFTA